MRGEIKQHLLDSVSMESKKMHKKKKSQNARSVRWTQSKISKHTTAHSTKNSAYKSKNDKQMIVLSQLEMSFEDIATVIIVSKTNLY